MIVEFDSTKFRNRHPYFNEDRISDDALEYQFQVASTIIDNTENSFIPYDPDKNVFDREILMYTLVCHLAAIAMRNPTQAGSIASAGEGSVNVSFTTAQSSEEYYSMTPCGQTFWRLMKKYRAWGGIGVYPQEYHPYG